MYKNTRLVHCGTVFVQDFVTMFQENSVCVCMKIAGEVTSLYVLVLKVRWIVSKVFCSAVRCYTRATFCECHFCFSMRRDCTSVTIVSSHS